MTKNWTIIAVILVLVLVGLGYILSQRGKLSQTTTPSPATVEVTNPAATPSETSPSAKVSSVTVKITSSGFSPQTITIKAGDSVTWMNDDSSMHNVSSAPHPTHTDYPPLNLGNIQPGASKSLTFPTAGTYKYHDHLNPSLTGSVVGQ